MRKLNLSKDIVSLCVCAREMNNIFVCVALMQLQTRCRMMSVKQKILKCYDYCYKILWFIKYTATLDFHNNEMPERQTSAHFFVLVAFA